MLILCSPGEIQTGYPPIKSLDVYSYISHVGCVSDNINLT